MPEYLLHGLWLPESGLNIWIEQVSGHRVVTIDAVRDGTFPSHVQSLLSKNHFRGRQRLQLQTPKGKVGDWKKRVVVRACERTCEPGIFPGVV